MNFNILVGNCSIKLLETQKQYRVVHLFEGPTFTQNISDIFDGPIAKRALSERPTNILRALFALGPSESDFEDILIKSTGRFF